MSGPDIQAAYFSPIHFLIYLTIIFAIMIAYYQWQWAKKCNTSVKVLVVRPDGSTDTEYAPKSSGYVALKNPDSSTTRLWPINKLSAIEMLYPGDGFIPVFLQKKIKTVIVDQEDWEPLLNRGSYTHNVASPDVVSKLRDLADDYPDIADEVNNLVDSLSTAPTRDLVASPAVLGNIMKEKVSELAVTVSRDTLDRLEGLNRRLDRLPNALFIYIGLGVVAVVCLIALVRILPVATDLAAIKGVLGIP